MNSKENPIAAESSISKFISKFSGSSKNEKKNDKIKENIGRVSVDFLGMNNAIPICAEACACCWDKKVPEGYQDTAGYIAKRTRIGHTSVIEHSNFVILITTPKKYSDELIELLDCCNYLGHRTVEDDNTYYTILGGSFRGYSDLFKEMINQDNVILKEIRKILYTYSHSAMFEDLGKLGLMDMKSFIDCEPDENFQLLTDTKAMSSSDSDNELFKIIGIDSIRILYNNIKRINQYVAENISFYDLLKFTTVSVLFKNMSRTCTHQLVRHRNAITQESQRYVDYSSACFSSPALFKPDKYDKDHKYTITFGTGPNQKMTLDELGEELCKIYKQLNDKHLAGDYALLKEDARAYLPGNVQCKKIYMTFTFKNLLKFLSLREHPSAQAEIRKYAIALGDYIRENTDISSKDMCEEFTLPRFLIGNDNVITMSSEDEEVNQNITSKSNIVDEYVSFMFKCIQNINENKEEKDN